MAEHEQGLALVRDIAACLRDLREVWDLPMDHPRRIARTAEKDRLVRIAEERALPWREVDRG